MNEHPFNFLHINIKVDNIPVFTTNHKGFFFPSTTIEWKELDTNFKNS